MTMAGETMRGEYGPGRLAVRLGLARWQLRLAVQRGLLPAPDRAEGRWSAERAAECLLNVDQVRTALGDQPPIGALRAAARLAQRVALDVDKADIESLVVAGDLTMVGHYRTHPLYNLQELDALPADLVTGIVKARKGRLFETVDAKGAALLLAWPKEVFERVAADRSLATDQLGRYQLADVRALATDPEVRQMVEQEERALTLENARETAARAEEAVSAWLRRCSDYLARNTDEMPTPAEVGSALRALAAARAELRQLE